MTIFILRGSLYNATKCQINTFFFFFGWQSDYFDSITGIWYRPAPLLSIKHYLQTAKGGFGTNLKPGCLHYEQTRPEPPFYFTATEHK